MHRGLALEPVGCALERLDAPVLYVVRVGVHVERRLVELDHVDAERCEFARFLVQDLGKLQRQARPILVVHVLQSVDDGHRSRQGVLDWVIGFRAQQAHVIRVHRARARDRPHDLRHLGIVALANVHRDQVLEIDAFQVLEIAGHKVASRLLAVAQDVDARALLVADHKPGCIALGLGQALAFRQPRRPQLVRLREPGGLGQATGYRRLQQRFAHRNLLWVLAPTLRAWIML